MTRREKLAAVGEDLTRRAASALGQAQGLAGVGCLTAGAYLLYGRGQALVVLGVFLLVGAWARR